MKSFDFTSSLHDNIIPCCINEKVAPWVFTHLLFVHKIKLSAPRCEELLQWTKTYVQEDLISSKADKVEKLKEIRGKLSHLYTVVLRYHHSTPRSACYMIDIMVFLKQHKSIEWIFNRINSGTSFSCNYSRSKKVMKAILNAVQSLDAGTFSSQFIDNLVEKISVSPQFLGDSDIICSLIIILHSIRSSGTAEEWLHFHFQTLGHNVDNKKVWQIFSHYEWHRFLTPCHPANIDLTDSVETIHALIEGLLAIDDTPRCLPTIERAAKRIGELSSVTNPLLIDMAKLLRTIHHHLGQTILKDRGVQTNLDFAFLKTLCDRKDYHYAVKFLEAKRDRHSPRADMYAEILVLEGCTEYKRVFYFSKIHDLEENSQSQIVYSAYDHILRRYLEHRPQANTVDSLSFLDLLIKQYRTKVQKVSAAVDHVDARTTSSTLLDEYYPDILYNRMDQCYGIDQSEKLFKYVTQIHPRIDEILVQTVLNGTKSSDISFSAYEKDPSDLFSNLNDVSQFLNKYDKIYVFDASSVEYFVSTEALISTGPSDRILLAVPFVSLREACLTLMKDGNAEESCEGSDHLILLSLQKLIRCLASGHLSNDGNSSGVGANVHVKLIHPTEELLLRQIQVADGHNSEILLEKYASSARKLRQGANLFGGSEVLIDDDDRVLYVAASFSALVSENADGYRKNRQVFIATLDENLVKKAEILKIPAIQMSMEVKQNAENLNQTSTVKEPYFNTMPTPHSQGTRQGSAKEYANIEEDVNAYYRRRKNVWKSQHVLRSRIQYMPAWNINVKKVNVRDPANKTFLAEYLMTKTQLDSRTAMRSVSPRK